MNIITSEAWGAGQLISSLSGGEVAQLPKLTLRLCLGTNRYRKERTLVDTFLFQTIGACEINVVWSFGPDILQIVLRSLTDCRQVDDIFVKILGKKIKVLCNQSAC